jgi:hypothetical protein
MSKLRRILLCALFLRFLSPPAGAERLVRVATYNIKYLSTDVQSQGDRLNKLQQVIELLDADVIGL